MDNRERFRGAIFTDLPSRAAFSGPDEKVRVDAVRKGIQHVRAAWPSPDQYAQLQQRIREFIHSHNKDYPAQLWQYFDRLLSKFDTYADMMPDAERISFRDDYTAVEMYCSAVGYDFLFGLVLTLLRGEQLDEEVLNVVATLVEFLTIELYNLRLANIGDPRYSNFQGVTYRGMKVSADVVEDFRRIATNPDMTKRNFAIPLGMISSTASKKTMDEFASDDDREAMNWVIHIHGLDPDLLSLYHERYPESVVTSLCAMPVDRISEFGEQEILLRGPFFHIISMETGERAGKPLHTIVMMMMNSNRDHGTELSSNEGVKGEQRQMFNAIIRASRYEICEQLAKETSATDSAAYADLAKAEFRALSVEKYRTTGAVDAVLAASEATATWFGSTDPASFPSNYAKIRLKFQAAIKARDWIGVEELLSAEYEWTRGEWYSMPNLREVESKDDTLPLIHELARAPRAESEEQQSAWKRLVQQMSELHVWRTTRAGTAKAVKAIDLIHKEDRIEMTAEFEPSIVHEVSDATLQAWEQSLRLWIEECCGQLVGCIRCTLTSTVLMTCVGELPMATVVGPDRDEVA